MKLPRARQPWGQVASRLLGVTADGADGLAARLDAFAERARQRQERLRGRPHARLTVYDGKALHVSLAGALHHLSVASGPLGTPLRIDGDLHATPVAYTARVTAEIGLGEA